MKKRLKFGHHLEICFSVDNLKESIEFYEKLGFNIYTGGPDKGWCSMTNGMIFIALFPDKFIEKEFNVPVLFNYRGGNIDKIAEFLTLNKLETEKKKFLGQGTGDIILKDINGIKFYFDTSKDEERVDIP